MGIVAKYKFDGSVYADLIPEFNAEFTNYTITDEVDSENSNHIIRTIESDSLPTLMRFGNNLDTYVEGNELALLKVLDMNTSGLTSCYRMFRCCANLTNITCDWNTSNVTTMYAMFYRCYNLTTLDVSNFDTSNTTTMYCMFYGCKNLTMLDLNNFDTSNVTNMADMFTSTNNLKYLKCNNVSTLNALNTYLPTKSSASQGTIICKSDITNLDITTLQSKYWTVSTNPTLIAKYKYDSKIYKNLIPAFNKGYMGFVEDVEVDANGVVTRVIEHVELPTYVKFGYNDTIKNTYSYAYKDIQYVNCTKINSINYMFRGCTSLINLNVSDWNLNKITSCHTSFADCISMTSIIGLDMIDVSEVTSFAYMFSACKTLQKLDISNFKFKSDANLKDMFNNTPLLTDIGMIYCNQSTINKVASLLPTDHNITIWVESDDILQYDQYDHITYKTQKVQDTVHLNSPLLKGDTIEVIDGKTYHVHRWEKVVLDGSEGWNLVESQTVSSSYLYQTAAYSGIIISENHILNILCDKMNTTTANENWNNTVLKNGISLNKYGNISIRCENITSVNDFKAWLSNNILNVIAPLVTPYYELISEEPLELTLLDTTDNTINNNSILPSNMTIANKELSTIAIKPSTVYTLSFDKSNVDSEVTIDICGGEQITTVLNRIELTTPSELGSGIRFISSDGCIISNVRLLEGSLVEKAIPKETFEGLQNSFDDGYIIGENLANDKEDYFYEETGNWGNGTILFKQNLKANTTYTLVRKISNIKYGVLNGVSFYDMAYYTDGTFKQDHNCWYNKNGWYISKYIPTKDVTKFEIMVGNNNSSGTTRPRITVSDYMIFEGDHTHLSEVELMRYIEKGTSHYKEEDYNHVGKYKVQYKVTGKNKCVVNNFTDNYGGITFTMKDNVLNVKGTNTGNCYKYFYPNIDWIKGKTYTLSVSTDASSNTPFAIVINTETNNYFMECYIKPNEVRSVTKTINETIKSFRIIPTITTNPGDILNVDFNVYIQLEEGTVATEYEPYKEDIKTYYLSSPLLEGDTIEDINGVATHVKRYGKVVLDGSEDWWEYNQSDDTYSVYTAINLPPKSLSDNIYEVNYFTNAVIPSQDGASVSYNFSEGIYFRPDLNLLYIKLLKSRLSTLDINTFKQWLQANPITAVYELLTPQYEPISTEPILLDSYTNGHLDLSNENIPIEKVKFINWYDNLKYLQSNTRYTVRFESDNVGKLDTLGVGGTYLYNQNVVKGLNEFILTTNNTPTTTLSVTGIGFNISNIQVVEANEDIEFGYFKGLQSSFEDGLVTDENDENYGKYKVECKIVGKNKCDGEYTFGHLVNNNYSPSETICHSNYIKVKPNSTYIISKDTVSLYRIERINLYDKNKNYINKIWGTSLPFNIPQNINYIRYTIVNTITEDNGDMIFNPIVIDDIPNFQIEEGTQATSYEPYKESIHTLYLNSPLLKGDKLVVHDGKLCHYHKMGMVVLDGSKDEYWSKAGIYIPFVVIRNVGLKPNGNMGHDSTKGKMCTNILQPNIITSTAETDNRKGIYVVGSGEYNEIRIRLTDNDTVNSVKQWLQQNPTTVVYELAEPYYEPIEPQLSSNSFSTIKDGDMEIITALPIEKINLTYRTDINGVSSIEEQIASIQEGTDISSIIDEEVDE